jgi:hypothetical protein
MWACEGMPPSAHSIPTGHAVSSVATLGPNEDQWDERFRATLADPENVLVRFTPDTVVTRDVSYRGGC